MSISDELLEALLNEDESSALDFKEAQYLFYGGSKEQKAELLKDVLAFANAWRHAAAYILIGVREIQGGRSEVIGLGGHLNDADLQQFVNAKTQRPVEFSYSARDFEGKQVGVLEIPLQQRPFYLTKAFGKLQAETVYLRRGSSTATASLDEIARMGSSTLAVPSAPAILRLQFADLRRRELLGPEVPVTSTILRRLDHETLMPHANPWMHPAYLLSVPDESYYKELVEHTYDKHLLVLLGFGLSNSGSVAAREVIAVARVSRCEGLSLTDEPLVAPTEYPVLNMPSPLPVIRQLTGQIEPAVEVFPDRWEVTIRFGKALPGATLWTDYPLLIGAEEELSANFDFEVYSEDLREPIAVRLTARIGTERRSMTLEDIYPEVDASGESDTL